MNQTPKKPFLGLCPIGKFVFSQTDAQHFKKLLQQKLKAWEVPFVDLEGVLPDGIIKDQKHVDTAVEHFRKAGIDCLFVPHCNFGTEGAVGMIAHKLGLPTLLWGPRDEAPLPDGTRLRDSLCGLFASSKVLHKLNVKYTYIENCRIKEPIFQNGVDTFLRAVSVAKLFRKGFRIGQLGQRIDFFWTTIINESELLERFQIEVLPIGMIPFLERVHQRAEQYRGDYLQKAQGLRREYRIVGMNDDNLINTLACADEMVDTVRQNNLDALAIEEFMPLIDSLGIYTTFAEAIIGDQFAMGFESDIHGAVSDLMLRAASYYTKPAWLADLTVRHPTDENGILLWHGGASLAMRDSDVPVEVSNHWILPSPLTGMPHFKLQSGPITVTRFDGDRGEYQLAIGQGHSMDGPVTRNNYAWMKVDNWPHWERTFIEGPFIHHVGMLYGQLGPALHEACKFITGLKPIRLGGY